MRKPGSAAGRDTMHAVRVHPPGGLDGVRLEQIEIPRPGDGEALVRVHAAAITRDELGWSVDRLPAIPSYELSGVVVEVIGGDGLVSVGDDTYALAPFDRDGAAADYAVVPANALAPKPRALGHVETAALPLAALSAWQGLIVYGGLQAGHRVLIHGAGGGVGHLAVQIARHRGAHVIGTVSPSTAGLARDVGAHELIDRTVVGWEQSVEPVDLVFDTVGGDVLARSAAFLRDGGGRVVSVAEPPPEGMDAVYFVVESDRGQLVEMAHRADQGDLRPAIDSVFPLVEAREAFARSIAPGKHGKVVLRVVDE
jgi:NADPH:quinone reductase-like Zn-dependent oxidoreductase